MFFTIQMNYNESLDVGKPYKLKIKIFIYACSYFIYFKYYKCEVATYIFSCFTQKLFTLDLFPTIILQKFDQHFKLIKVSAPNKWYL